MSSLFTESGVCVYSSLCRLPSLFDLTNQLTACHKSQVLFSITHALPRKRRANYSGVGVEVTPKGRVGVIVEAKALVGVRKGSTVVVQRETKR